MEKVGAHVIVSGKVQGVFYRAETQKAAVRFGVVGWVRNRPDGTVEALMEGEQEDVEALISWCRGGPPMALVEKVDVERTKHSGDFVRFEITY